MKTNNERTNSYRAGLRISVSFPVKNDCALIDNPSQGNVKPDNACRYANGTEQGAIYHANSIARAFAGWLTPASDSGETVRAQWSCHNPETGEIEADVFPEFVADVMAKIHRLKPRFVSFHTVSL